MSSKNRYLTIPILLLHFFLDKSFANTTNTPWYSGIVYPTHSDKILAPQNVFKMRHSSMSSSNIVLAELQADGTQVKDNDLICNFEFMGLRYLHSIDRYIKEMKAEKDEAHQESAAAWEKLVAEEYFLKIAVTQANINLEKAKFLAKKDFSLTKIEQELTNHKLLTHQRLMEAEKNKAKAEKSFHQGKLDEATQDKVRYEVYKSQYQVLANRPVTVRHVFSKDLGRKIKKGDNFQSGTHVLSIASDNKLSVEFYVDEDRHFLLQQDRKIEIELPDGSILSSKIREYSRFPQMIGFLFNNHDRTDAKAKAYKVFADLPEEKKLQAGMDVRVSLIQ